MKKRIVVRNFAVDVLVLLFFVQVRARFIYKSSRYSRHQKSQPFYDYSENG